MKHFISFFFLAIFIGLVLYAHYYLVYTDRPLKSDVIVLLLGPDFEAREKEAHQLITEGYANHLIIPAYGKILKATDNGSLFPIKQNPFIQNSKNLKKKEKINHRIYEDTHLEILYAKKMMAKLNFSSANFVSSPYHMRRIKLIAGRVFNRASYKISFVPSRYENVKNNLWWAHKTNIKSVISEYIKIVWFLLYSPFLQMKNM